MLLDIIKQFNWVDVVIILIVLRMSLVALKTGFLVEIFKFLGTVLAIYCSLHYYIALSDFFKIRIGLQGVPLKFLDFMLAVLLAVLGYLIFWGIRIGFDRFIKMETTPNISKAGGLLLGIIRGILLASLITFLLTISSVDYLQNSATSSFSGRRILNIAPNTYTWIWNSITSHFMTDEKFNEIVPEVQKDLKQ